MTSPTLRIARRLRRTWRTRPPRVAGSALRNSTPRSTGSTRKASREPDRRLPRDGVTQPCPYPRCDKDLFTLTRRAISGLADQPYPEGAVAWGATGVYWPHAGDIRILGRGRHQGHEGQRSVVSKQGRGCPAALPWCDRIHGGGWHCDLQGEHHGHDKSLATHPRRTRSAHR